MGRFEIVKRKNNEFQFNLKVGNGQIVLSSSGYIEKTSCIKGINSVVKNCKNINQFERLQAHNGKYYFNLKSEIGSIIGTSEMYESLAARDLGIYSVMKNAPEATILDLT